MRPASRSAPHGMTKQARFVFVNSGVCGRFGAGGWIRPSVAPGGKTHRRAGERLAIAARSWRLAGRGFVRRPHPSTTAREKAPMRSTRPVDEVGTRGWQISPTELKASARGYHCHTKVRHTVFQAAIAHAPSAFGSSRPAPKAEAPNATRHTPCRDPPRPSAAAGNAGRQA
jgi:hypothetical protein